MLILALLLLLSLPLIATGYVLFRLALWLYSIFSLYQISERKAMRKKFLLSLAYLAGCIAFLGLLVVLYDTVLSDSLRFM